MNYNIVVTKSNILSIVLLLGGNDMKKLIKLRTIIFALLLVFICVFNTGCSSMSNEMKNIRGELVGNHFDINFYDNNGENILNIEGQKVGLESNYVQMRGFDSEGKQEKTYDLSNVVTITVDGNQINQTGNTVIFVEDGIEKVEDVRLLVTIKTEGGSMNIVDRNLTKITNVLGTSKVIVICSQLGTPIAVYGGEKVYWSIPDNLPKTTKLNVDGKALYIHRANYILLDSEIIKGE